MRAGVPLRGRVASRNDADLGSERLLVDGGRTAPAQPSPDRRVTPIADATGPGVAERQQPADRHVLHHPREALAVDARVHRRHRTQHAVDHQHRGARLVVGEPGPDLAEQVHPLGHRHPVDAREPPARVVVERAELLEEHAAQVAVRELAARPRRRSAARASTSGGASVLSTSSTVTRHAIAASSISAASSSCLLSK